MASGKTFLDMSEFVELMGLRIEFVLIVPTRSALLQDHDFGWSTFCAYVELVGSGRGVEVTDFRAVTIG